MMPEDVGPERRSAAAPPDGSTPPDGSLRPDVSLPPDGSLPPEEQVVHARLAALAVAFERRAHPPVTTVDEAAVHWEGLDATHCKNLFLRNQKGTRHYLVIVLHSKRVDLRAVAGQIGDGKLSFASAERLRQHLGVAPGSVSPFGLIHDRDHHVRVYLDRDLRSASRVSFHPNVNTATLVLERSGFERFLSSCGNSIADIVVNPA